MNDNQWLLKLKLSPLKLSSLIEFMINLCIQNFITSLVPVPLRIEEYQRKVGIKTKQDPAGPSWVQKPLCVPPFLVYRVKALVSLAFPEFQRADPSSY